MHEFVKVNHNIRGNIQSPIHVSPATRPVIKAQTAPKGESTIKLNNLILGGQAPELLALRIKIADKWCTAIFDTGCTHSIIHPKLVKDNMKKTNCYAKIITTILSEPYAARSQVNVKFNPESDGNAKVQFKMYVAPIPYNAILGMDFINGVDMSNTIEGQWLIKYFKGSNDLIRTSIPLYKYPINKNTIHRRIKTQTGTNTDFKLTNIQKLNLLTLEVDRPNVVNSPSNNPTPSNHTIPPIQPPTIQNNQDEEKRMKDEAHKIFNKFKDIFVEQIPKFDPPSRQGFDMEVKVAQGSLPVKRSYNKMSEEEANKIETEIKRLFDSRVIEESVSSYSAPVFIATNKGKERVVFDYRGVNKQTEEFAFPIPNGEDILKATKNCKYFSVVDAKSGFHLLQVKKEHRSFTAFSFKGKLYQFRRAPCNYLRRFIPNYSELTARLAALTGTKTTRITINNEMKEDIKRLKQAITSEPVLAKPDFTKSFDVYIDASYIGTGCVIIQDDGNGNIRPIFM
ncbi:hypothetical protein ACTFIR_003861 [Dictyostelium discoideum]